MSAATVPVSPPEDRLACVDCGRGLPLAALASACSACGGVLDVVVAPRPPEADSPGPATTGLWRWHGVLPFCAPANRVTLGEAGTPLLHAARLGARLGVPDLWIKNEAANPTGSFKDRALALAVSLARQHGCKGLVLSSSGNAGAAAAAYAARAGLPVTVVVPATAPAPKLAQITVTGATLLPVEGPTSAACARARALAAARGWLNGTTTFDLPCGVDAYATLADELADLAPDAVLLPISSGPLLAGVAKGFARLHAGGALPALPRPVAVQSVACAPLVRAFETGGPVRPWAHRPTVASALNDTLDGYERQGDHTLAWLRRQNGAALAVADADVLAAGRSLAEAEGVFVEPSAAAALAGLILALRNGTVGPRERVVLVTTGHGLKDPGAWA